jgi:hypothetical protein
LVYQTRIAATTDTDFYRVIVLVILIQHCLFICMHVCVGFVHEQFDLFIILSIGRVKHSDVHTRTMLMIILCLYDKLQSDLDAIINECKKDIKKRYTVSLSFYDK